MKIREERPEDYNSILRLTYEAFLTLDYPGRLRMDEHFLVSLLQGSDYTIPELCYVAERDDEIVGHILYTKSEVAKADGTRLPTITFGPLSVLPRYHKQGIGAALVGHSIDRARDLGHGAILIVGVSDYYPKLGFKRARDYGLTLDDGTSPDEFMVFELLSGYLSGGGVLSGMAPEFVQAEDDDAGFDSFHRWFMSEYYPGELTLRPLFDKDLALMKRWLRLDHVKLWYEDPGEWIREISNRRGEFSFITHFIAEFEGMPVGFCQYYDMFHGQGYEEWIKTAKPGSQFSIDYLIGEPEYLHRGLGQIMIGMLLGRLRNLGVKTVVVNPDEGNVKSSRALEANKFVWNGTDYVLELT